MLNRIHIKNFAIIDELEINFLSGMNVLTGETGAGKSIIIDAVELALGKRVYRDVIGQQGDCADIFIEFDIKNIPGASQFLKAYDLEGEDNVCFVRRVIRHEGSKSYINQISVTLKILQDFSESLINIHGQHEFQTLLRSDQQRDLLDRFIGQPPFIFTPLSFPQGSGDPVDREVKQVFRDDYEKATKSQNRLDLIRSLQQIYDDWLDCKNELDALRATHQDATNKREFLLYQIKELDELNLAENEFEEIAEEYKKLANADLLLNNCREAINLLFEQDFSANDLLNSAARSIASVKNFGVQLSNVLELLESAQIQTQEAAIDIQNFLDKLDLDPERFEFLENRIQKIQDISRKHHVESAELFNLHQQLKEELNNLNHSDERLKILEENLTELEKNYFYLADQLTEKRKNAASKLSAQVTENIQQLGMPGGVFKVALEPFSDRVPRRFGLEKITFLVSANPGQPLQLLAQVASGGELSRISLAIQVVTTGATPILIFDEVDVGIGGAVAEIVGKLLRELALNNQIICITHLAQVASCGHHHFQVIKEQLGQTTRASIKRLDRDERTLEIARMLGGIHITDQALAHAEEMLSSN
ncbi:MAG: DNA repair protein RecN [Gammaproteobacteria bacterium]|nr:DNA repair protein RecN [Gammaproteobacteria bacterium]